MRPERGGSTPSLKSFRRVTYRAWQRMRKTLQRPAFVVGTRSPWRPRSIAIAPTTGRATKRISRRRCHARGQRCQRKSSGRLNTQSLKRGNSVSGGAMPRLGKSSIASWSLQTVVHHCSRRQLQRFDGSGTDNQAASYDAVQCTRQFHHESFAPAEQPYSTRISCSVPFECRVMRPAIGGRGRP